MPKENEFNKKTLKLTPDDESYKGHRQRLREKIINISEHSMQSIPDYELLEMLLFLFNPRKDVKPLAKLLIKELGSIAEIMNHPIEEIKKFSGIGETTISNIRLLREIFLRTLKQDFSKQPILSNWKSVLDYCRLKIGFLKHEELYVLFLDHRLNLVADFVHEKGSINSIFSNPREIVKQALSIEATNLILIHNHPAGNANPSKSDISLTKHIQNALKTMDITLIDHIIITKNQNYSFKSNDLL